MHVRLRTHVRTRSTSACEQCVCMCAVFVCGATTYCAWAVLWLVVPRVVVVVVLVAMTVRAAVWHEAAAQAHRRAAMQHVLYSCRLRIRWVFLGVEHPVFCLAVHVCVVNGAEACQGHSLDAGAATG
jgi:hypothetical protein